MNTTPVLSTPSGNDEALWQRLVEYSFDNPDAEMSLRDRLARDNNWSMQYAHKVLEEYRRFVYLAIKAGHPVTPSEDVDQAWHLHLLYTREYWEHFCPKVLGCPLHHGPTRGGSAEGDKYADWYSRTLESYRVIFNCNPPDEIWPNVQRRFHEAGLFRRVNVGTHFVLSRRWLRSGLTAAALLGSVMFVTRFALADEQGGDSSNVFAMQLLAIGGVLAIVVVWLVFDHRRQKKLHPRSRRGGNRGNKSSSFGAGCGSSGSAPSSKSSGKSTDGGSDGGGGCGAGCGS